jgi:hypothetical protein
MWHRSTIAGRFVFRQLQRIKDITKHSKTMLHRRVMSVIMDSEIMGLNGVMRSGIDMKLEQN